MSTTLDKESAAPTMRHAIMKCHSDWQTGIGCVQYLAPEHQTQYAEWCRGKIMSVVDDTALWFDKEAIGYTNQPVYDAIRANLHQTVDGYIYDGDVAFVSLQEADAIRAEYKCLVEAQTAKVQAAVEAEQQCVDDCYRNAKETGQPVAVDVQFVWCNDPREECERDVITVYAMPDGSTKQCRQHTW